MRVAACGICGSDLHFLRGDHPRPVGTCPGHEFAGIVEDGPVGLPDRLYAVSPNVACGTCDFCRNGETNLCARGGYGLGLGRNGGLAEYVDVPASNLAPTGSDDPALAAMTEPLAVALRAVGLGRPRPDSRILVLGAGAIGLSCALLARDRCGEVAVTARHPHQRAAAETLGVVVVDEDDGVAWAKEHRPDIVIETVGGTADTLTPAIKACRRGGTIVLVGAFTEPKAVDLSKLMMKELRLQGSFCYGSTGRGPEFAAAAELTGRYEGELRALSTHRFDLADTLDAFAAADDKSSGAIKVTILP